jgi:CheY-like chemotaxis protein
MISTVVASPLDVIPQLLTHSPRVKDSGNTLDSSKATTDAIARQRVLVVDDEELIADSVAEILNRNGYHAIALYSSQAAIQSAEEQCPDIIVSDVIMPAYNGIQMARAIRRHCPETRILLFSGNAATSSLLENAAYEGDSFELLAKPVHPVQLLKALKQQ